MFVERSARKGGVSEQERSVQCEVPRQTGRLTRLLWPVDTALNAALCAPPQDGVREITLDGDDVKVSAPAAAAGAAMDTTA